MANPSEKLHPNRQEDEQDMEMTPVIMAPPSYGSPDPNTGVGALVSLSETHHDVDPSYGADHMAAGAVEGNAAASEGESDGKPAKSATREEWNAYAESQGVDPEQFSSKDELMEYFA